MDKSTNKTEKANTESKTCFSFTGTRETSRREKPLKSNQAWLEDVSLSAAWELKPQLLALTVRGFSHDAKKYSPQVLGADVLY